MPRPSSLTIEKIQAAVAEAIRQGHKPTNRYMRTVLPGSAQILCDGLKQVGALNQWKRATKENRTGTGSKRSERQRQRADELDLTTENDRLVAENERLVAENDHLVAENNRLAAENDRLGAENNHLYVENSRLRDENREVVDENYYLKKVVAASAPMTNGARLPTSHPFYGLTIGEAAAKQLEITRSEMTPGEIAGALKKTGYIIEKKDAGSSVGQALMRRAATVGDVVKLARGRWISVAALSSEALENMRSNWPVDPLFHSEKTRVGMQRAINNGARVGRPPKLSPRDIDAIVTRHHNGESLRSIAESLGVSRTTLFNALKAHRET